VTGVPSEGDSGGWLSKLKVLKARKKRFNHTYRKRDISKDVPRDLLTEEWRKGMNARFKTRWEKEMVCISGNGTGKF